MATLQQLQTWLDEAETAQHELLTGQRAVTISSASGKSVTFSAGQAGQLSAYIASLKRQLGLSTVKPVRPILG